MEKTKKFKIYLGIFYFISVSLFLYLIFSQFSFEEITSYKFIQSNRDHFLNLKESSLVFVSLIFIIFTAFFIFMLGFGSPIALIGGFIFGKWLGVLLVCFGLSLGATFLYIFANYL